MKLRFKSITQCAFIAALFASMVSTAYCSFTINYFYGYNYNSSSTKVSDGTLWMLVVDANNDNTFAGGFGLNQGLATSGNANSAFTTGQTLSIGDTIGGGDRIFAMGGFNSSSFPTVGGTSGSLTALNLGTNGLATGLEYAFYWFPGASYVPLATSGTIGSQVGGVNSIISELGLTGMIIPSDSALVSQGAYGNELPFNGSSSVASMTAVNLIPEPSSFLLTVLGVFGFVVRRRR